MTARKLSKQQKTILVALRELEDFSKEFSMLHRFVLIVTGVDTWELELQNREFYRNRGHGPNSWRKREEGPRPIYDANRLKSNKAFATVSRSLARLAQRGLVSFRVNKSNRRYPVFTDEGRRALSEMSQEESKQIGGKVDKIDEALKKAAKENEKQLREALRELASIIKS